MKKFLFAFIGVAFLVMSNCYAIDRKSTNFHSEVKKYVSSGEMFRSIWSNVTKVDLMKEICPGGFLVAVDYRDGGRRYYEVRSFEFPLPNEVLSQIKDYFCWNAETIRRNNIQSLGLIIVNGFVKEHGLVEQRIKRYNFNRGGFFAGGKWEFAQKRDNSLFACASEIADEIYIPSINLQKKYLGDREINFLKNPKQFYETDHADAIWKEIGDIAGWENEKIAQKKKKEVKKELYDVDWKKCKFRIKVHNKYGKILIYTGEILNNDTSRMIPQLFCNFYSSDKPPLHIKEKLYIGTPIPDNDLLEMDKEEIIKRLLQNNYPDGTIGRTRCQFTAIFFNIPDDLTENKIFPMIGIENP